MFDANLLDSSPARTPVLTAGRWVAALVVGAVGFGAGYLGLPLVLEATPKALVAESALLGIGLMLYELMLLYVLADARRIGLSVGKWSVILLVLNVAGFVAYLICAAIKTGDWKRAAIPLAYIMEGVVLCVLLLIPLVHTEALPHQRWLSEIFSPPAPPPGPPPARGPRVRVMRRPAAPTDINPPSRIPTHITFLQDKPVAPPDVGPEIQFPGPGVPGGTGRDGVPGGIFTGNNIIPPPPIPEKHSTTQRIHVGGVVEKAKLIFHPNPVYPPLAIISRTEGTVLLQAVISKDGTIQDLKALSGHPLLVRAAMEAVARWRYQPTLLNGEPVEVVTEVEVNFILGDR